MNDFRELLKNENSLNETINKLNEIYNLDQKYGIMTKSIVINGLEKIIKILNIKKR
jgi:uncharacterized membrane protein